MSSLLNVYLKLEGKMVEADEDGDESISDSIKDAMDVLWHGLTDEDIAYLNGRYKTGPPPVGPTPKWS